MSFFVSLLQEKDEFDIELECSSKTTLFEEKLKRPQKLTKWRRFIKASGLDPGFDPGHLSML